MKRTYGKKEIDNVFKIHRSAFSKYLEEDGNKKLDFGEYFLDIMFASTLKDPFQELDLEDITETTGNDINAIQKAIKSLKSNGIKELYHSDYTSETSTIKKFKKGVFDNYHFYIFYAYGGFDAIFMTKTPIDESIFKFDDTIEKSSKEEVEEMINENLDEDEEDNEIMTKEKFLKYFKDSHKLYLANPKNTYKDKLERADVYINKLYGGIRAKEANGGKPYFTPKELLAAAGVSNKRRQ